MNKWIIFIEGFVSAFYSLVLFVLVEGTATINGHDIVGKWKVIVIVICLLALIQAIWNLIRA